MVQVELFHIASIFLISLIASFVSLKYLMKRFRRKGIVVNDYYKKAKTELINMGGLGITFGIISGLVLSQIFSLDSIGNLLIFYFIVLTYGIFTLLDDLVDIGHRIKIIVPIFLSLPIALLINDTTIYLGFFELALGEIYLYIIAPLYIMVVANLVNMHSGFNGMQSGMSTIILATIAIKSYFVYGLANLPFVLPILGAILAFMYFNFYPSKIIEGNIGSFVVGSAIGGLLILNNFELFGIIILIPHIVNFLLYFNLRIILRKPFKKFGKVRSDGTIEAPYRSCLKWWVPYYFKADELKCSVSMYILTTVFCVIGLLLV